MQGPLSGSGDATAYCFDADPGRRCLQCQRYHIDDLDQLFPMQKLLILDLTEYSAKGDLFEAKAR